MLAAPTTLALVVVVVDVVDLDICVFTTLPLAVNSRGPVSLKILVAVIPLLSLTLTYGQLKLS